MYFVLLQTCGQHTRGKQMKCNGMDSILKAPVGVPKGAQYSTLVCMTLSFPPPPNPLFLFVCFLSLNNSAEERTIGSKCQLTCYSILNLLENRIKKCFPLA